MIHNTIYVKGLSLAMVISGIIIILTNVISHIFNIGSFEISTPVLMILGASHATCLLLILFIKFTDVTVESHTIKLSCLTIIINAPILYGLALITNKL